MKLSIYLGLRAMRSNLRTTLIVTGSITLAVVVVLVMSSLLFGFKDEFIGKTINATAHVRITTEAESKKEQPSTFSTRWELNSIENIKPPDLPDKIRGAKELVAVLRNNPEVIAVSPTIFSNVILRYGAISYPATLQGVLPDEENSLTGLFGKAVEGNVEGLKMQDKGLAIGKTIAKKLGVEVGNTLRLTARDGASYLFRVVAVVSTGVTSLDSSRLWVNLKDAQTVAGQYNEITDIGIKIKDYQQAEAFASRLGSSIDYRVEPWQKTNANILGLLVIIFANIFFVLGGLILAAGFGIFNVFSMSVIDRQKELAILRTMGFRQEVLTGSFLVQGLVVGLVGGVLGLLIGQVFIEWLSSLTFATASEQRPVSSAGFTMLKVWWLYVAVFALGLFLAVSSAILPAFRAGRISPIDVLRGG